MFNIHGILHPCKDQQNENKGMNERMKAYILISMLFLPFILHVLMCTVVQFGSFYTLFSLSVQQVTPNA